MKTQIYVDGKLMGDDDIVHYTIANYPNHVTKEIDVIDAKNMLDAFGHTVEEYAVKPCVVGIDNGLSGGIAILSQQTGSIIAMTPMPCKERKGKNEIDIQAVNTWLIKEMHGRLNYATYYIEEPCGSKSLGAALSMASSFHSLRGLMETKNLHWYGIQARQWQKELMGKTKIAASKQSEQAFALANWKDEKFPTLKPKGKKLHDGIIDACLIAEFGRRQYL